MTKQTAIGTVQGKPDKCLRKTQPNENRTRWTFEACTLDKKPTLGRYVSNKESQLRKWNGNSKTKKEKCKKMLCGVSWTELHHLSVLKEKVESCQVFFFFLCFSFLFLNWGNFRNKCCVNTICQGKKEKVFQNPRRYFMYDI